jgi:hypothetical protein
VAEPQIEPEFPKTTYLGGQGMPAMPGSATGPGGDMRLVNQNEREINENSWENVSCEYAGYQDDARCGGDV